MGMGGILSRVGVRGSSFRAPDPSALEVETEPELNLSSVDGSSGGLAERRRIDADRRSTGAADHRVAVVEGIDQQRLEIEARGAAGAELFRQSEVRRPEPGPVEIHVLPEYARLRGIANQAGVGAS